MRQTVNHGREDFCRLDMGQFSANLDLKPRHSKVPKQDCSCLWRKTCHHLQVSLHIRSMQQTIQNERAYCCRLDMGQPNSHHSVHLLSTYVQILEKKVSLTHMEKNLDCSFPSSSSQHSFLPHAADGPPLRGRLLQTRYGAALINSFHNFWDSSQL